MRTQSGIVPLPRFAKPPSPIAKGLVIVGLAILCWALVIGLAFFVFAIVT
jgi:hypothetical protein